MGNNVMERAMREDRNATENKNELKHEERKKYEYWLHNLPRVGDRTIEKLLAVFGNAEQIYKATGKELEQVIPVKEHLDEIVFFKKNWELEKKYHALVEGEISFCTIEDTEYPERLRKMERPPYAIYCKGMLPPENKPAIAMIGARECSGYGACMAEAFGKAMAMAGIPVISGMARGIDGISQQAALKAEGKSWAVLGCGVDICYPASNREIYDMILESGGGILSVVPPKTPPAKSLFPLRNRIVAGLCDVLLVVEARQKSGTWITVDMALEQGKSVYAIPGRLTDRLSDGCNMLIRQGAGIALSPEDLIAELKVMWNRRGEKETSQKKERKAGIKAEKVCEKSANTKENKKQNWENEKEMQDDVLRFLDFNPKSAEQIWEEMIAANIGKSLPEIFEQLIDACLMGKARQIAGSFFVKEGWD